MGRVIQNVALEGMVDLEGIKSEDMSIKKLFEDFYVVPDFQREYVWGPEEVEKLLEDIQGEFEQSTRDYRPDYFVGSIVTNHDRRNDVYHLIDGQQRVTTLFVVLCAIRDYLKELGRPLIAVHKQLEEVSVDSQGEEKTRYRVELQYEDSQDVLAQIAAKRSMIPIESISASTKSAVNLVEAYKNAQTFLRDGTEGLGGDADVVRKFYAFLMQNVKLIRIKTESLGRALWIFETINYRGARLDPMDLMKNQLFMNASEDEFETLKRRWKALVDTLYNARQEEPLAFMRYHILANYAKGKLQSDRVYDWLTHKDNRALVGYGADPIGFTDHLISSARGYVGFIQGRLADGTDCRGLRNVWHMSRTTRQHLILMMAAQGIPASAAYRLAMEVEALYFVFIVARRPKNYFESKFIEWAIKLREFTTAEQVDGFIMSSIVPERTALSEAFEMEFRLIHEDNLPRYRMKYILAKLAQYVDEIGYGSQSEFSLEGYLDKDVEVEHILASKAETATVDAFGGIEEANRWLGSIANLTLLEKPINVVAANKPLTQKLRDYEKSKLLLTSGISPAYRVGKNTAIDRALNNVASFDSWTNEAAVARLDSLVAIAKKVWGLDGPVPGME